MRKQAVAKRLLADIHIEQANYKRTSYTFTEWYVLLATLNLNYAGRWHREWLGWWRKNPPVTE
jgi:hypothetical protein